MDWKKLLPGLLIGGIAIFAILKLSQSAGGSSPVISNALIPTANTPPPDSRDPARTQAYSTLAGVALGQQRLEQEGKAAQSAIELAKIRFSEQSNVLLQNLGLQREGLATQLELEKIRQEGTNTRYAQEIADRNYDRALQEKALDQTYALAQTGAIGQQAGSVLSALMNALGRGNQQQSRPSSGGSAGSGGGTPPFNPNTSRPSAQQQAAARQNALARIGNWITGNSSWNQPIAYQDYDDLGYPQSIDLSQWDWLSGYGDDAFDYWNGYFNQYEPIGNVTSSYEFGGIVDDWSYIPSFTWNNSLGDNYSYDEWYYDEGWLYD